MKRRTLLAATGLLFSMGCSITPEQASASSAQDLTGVPSDLVPSVIKGLEWMHKLQTEHPDWYVESDPSEADAQTWGDDGYDPAQNPIFAHNAIAIAGVTPRDVLALLEVGRSDTYYPNSSAATDCATGAVVSLQLGTSYCWTTFGTEQRMTIVEHASSDTEATIAWEGGSAGIGVYHRWIMRKTAEGTLVTTEECERGLVPWIPSYRNRMDPALHAGHELWLRNMQALFAARTAQ